HGSAPRRRPDGRSPGDRRRLPRVGPRARRRRWRPRPDDGDRPHAIAARDRAPRGRAGRRLPLSPFDPWSPDLPPKKAGPAPCARVGERLRTLLVSLAPAALAFAGVDVRGARTRGGSAGAA